MSTQPMVPMFAPDGTLGEIPYDRMHEAVTAGGKIALKMSAPDGTPGYIPADQMHDAVAAGGKIIPLTMEDAANGKVGFLASLGGDLASMAKGAYNLLSHPGENVMNAPQKFKEDIQRMSQEDASRKTAGYSFPYRVGAPIAEAAGANVPGMEQAAASGDPNAVLGHAAAPMVPLAVAAALRAAAPAMSRAAEATSRKMYRSALKPSTTIPAPKVAGMIDTGLTNKIPVSETGAERIGALVDELNAHIKATIDADPTRPINKFKVASRLSDTAKKFQTQVNPAADMQAISESGNEFLQSQPGNIAAADAQALKQGTYRQLKGKSYGELKSATIEAQKSLARGLKEELNTAFPELKNLNAQESRLFDLEPVLQKALQRMGNHQLVGVGTPAVAGAGALLTKTAKGGIISGILKAVVDDPVVKSRLAIALNKAGRGKLSVAASKARIAAYATALSGGTYSSGDPSQSQP